MNVSSVRCVAPCRCQAPALVLVLFLALALNGLLAPSSSAAPDPTTDKPLRDLAADRPDTTESPITVDKGHFQLETAFFGYTRDKNDNTDVRTYAVAESNIKYGLLDNMDLQVVLTPWLEEETETATTDETVNDFGDIEVRLKYNIYGNDGGDTALGLMPFVKIPTQTEVSNDRWEGGLILPGSWDVADTWGLGAQLQLDRIYEDDSGDMEWEFSHTVVAGFEVFDRVGTYVEYVGIASEGGDYNVLASGGATYDLKEYVRLDVGTMVGLTDDAEDFSIFTGITWKY